MVDKLGSKLTHIHINLENDSQVLSKLMKISKNQVVDTRTRNNVAYTDIASIFRLKFRIANAIGNNSLPLIAQDSLFGM